MSTEFNSRIKSFFSSTDPWATAEDDLEEDALRYPAWDEKSRLANAKHALASGVPERVVEAALRVDASSLK
jgi:hypothetical protein